MATEGKINISRQFIIENLGNYNETEMAITAKNVWIVDILGNYPHFCVGRQWC